MATIRRAGFGTVFELEDSKVGIGTDAATHTLQALGNIRSEAATDIGISSLSTYQGFTDKEARFTGGKIDIESQSGSTSGEIVIDGDVTVSSATTFTSGPQNLTVTDTFTLPSGDTNSRALKPTAGSLRFNQDFATLEFYTGNNWATVNTFTEMQNSPSNRGRGVIGGGFVSPLRVSDIEFIEISTLGNALSFGDLTADTAQPGPAADSTRGLFCGGMLQSGNTNVIQYITIASSGNGIDFGDLTRGTNAPGALSSSTRCVTAGGSTPSASNVIDYFEIQTLGNALDFGDMTSTTAGGGGIPSPVRGVFSGGYSGDRTRIDFITIASKGNALRFGELTTGRGGAGTGGNGVRGITAAGDGNGHHNTIDYITIASEGNAIDFGDVGQTHSELMGSSCNSVRMCIAGGNSPGQQPMSNIDFITIVTVGNSRDFGNLSVARRGPASLSDSHGGLGGF